MDFFAMKRKKLQDLCKKHGIPANKANKEMAQKLSLIYKGKEEDPITIEDTDDEKEKGIGKFLAMKRRKLQDLCKKHGIPANWKSKKMAKTLSLIYKEKEDTDDTNINVQMEASDNAPGKECNADGKVGHEAEEQDHNNSPDKTGLVEEVTPLNENITEASTMCHDTSIGAKDTDGKTNVTVEDILDEVALAPGTDAKTADTCDVEETKIMRPASEKMIESSPKLISNSETTIDDMGVMKDDEDLQQVTSQDLQVTDMEICDMEEKVQLGVNKGQVDHIQEVFHTNPSDDIQVHDVGFSDLEVNIHVGVNEDQGDHCQEVVVVMKDKDDLVQVVSEDTQVDDMGFSDEEETMQISVNEEQVNYSQEVLNAEASYPDNAHGKKIAEHFLRNHKMVASEENLEDVNQEKVDNQEQHPTTPCSDAHVVSGEFCSYLVDGEVERLCARTFVFEDANKTGIVGDEAVTQDLNNSPDVTLSTMCLDKSVGAKDIDGKTNVTVEDILNEVNSDGTPVQFQLTDPLGEGTPILNDGHKIAAPDTCEAKFVSSQKISMSQASKKRIESSPKLTSNSETAIDDMGFGEVQENMHIGVQVGVNEEKIVQSQEVLHEEPSLVISKDLKVADMGVCDMEENIQLGDYKGQVDHSQEVFHTSPSVVFMNEDLVQVVSEDTQVDDMGFSDMEENIHIGIMHQMDALENAPGKESVADGKKIAEHFLKNHKMVASEENLQEGVNQEKVEENLQEGVNQEKVDDDNQEQHPTTLSSYAHVISGEFDNCLMEGEVEKLSERISVFEDTSETGKVGDESETQDHKNSPDVSLLLTSLKESSAVTGFVEEVNTLDDNQNICGHGAVYKDSNTSEASTMCLDTSIGAKDTDEKTNVTVEDILDEANSSSFEDSDGTPVQFQPTDPLGEVNTNDLDAHKMVAPGADQCVTQKISMSPASEKMIESSSKLISNSETAIDDMGLCDVEENTQTGVNKDQIDHSQEVLHEEPSVVVMKDDEVLQQVASQDLQVADMEICDMEETMQLGDYKGQVDHSQEDFHTKSSVEIMNEDLLQVVSEDMQIDVHKDQVDHTQEVLHAEPSVVVVKDDEDLLQVASQDLQVADMELCDMEENMQLGVNEDQGDHSQELLHAESSGVVMKEKDDLVQVALEDIKVDAMGFFDVGENKQIGVNEDQFSYSQEILHAEPSVVVMKDDEDCVKVASEDTQVNEEQVNYSQEALHGEDSVVLMKDDEDSVQVASEDIQVNDGKMHQMDALDADTCEEMLKSSQKTGQIADQEDCIGYFPNNNLEASVSTLGDVEVTMNEIMHSGKMEKENSQEECNFNRLFENSDIHDDTSGIGAETENQSYMMSHKRKWSDVDDTNGLDSAEKEKADGIVSTMTQLGEIESCDFNLHQIFASGTAYGDEATCYQWKLESPAKGTPIESSKKNINFSPKFHGSSMMNKGLENESSLPLISASDMKENIKIDKKEQVGSIMSKSKFAKRQPLQDLQQN